MFSEIGQKEQGHVFRDHVWTVEERGSERERQTEKERERERERLVSHEREESNSKVKGGSERTNNTESTDRGARGKGGVIERGSGKKESRTTT